MAPTPLAYVHYYNAITAQPKFGVHISEIRMFFFCFFFLIKLNFIYLIIKTIDSLHSQDSSLNACHYQHTGFIKGSFFSTRVVAMKLLTQQY